ncbi:epoxide hydrolase domain-containing protein [Plectosphaerella plurivora]|uniref:Epoxide hydrolase domain-containing protein n=1 Tax=Plectosphaerella plurivora TaxID=936078 RepID=A0A9P9A9S0_9PEZI|nr:epoxide hydrolase domain-containing protein [Plectosphaerella plurivora]
MATAKAFKIAVPDDQLAWINDRVRTARLPPGKDLPEEEIWKSWGLPPNHARGLHEYWTTKYDWRRVEAQLNAELSQFTIPITHNDEELSIHFVHHRSERQDAIPLLFLHGWPGSFLEVRPIIKLLTNPPFASDPAYHVVAPSLPGFGFSSYPSKPCSPMDIAEIAHKLMGVLGYGKFMLQGGDWGSIISRILAASHPESVKAMHLNGVVSGPPSPLKHPLAIARLLLAYVTGGWGLNEYQAKGLQRTQWFMTHEAGYQAIQGTKPQTLAYGLTDSPFGMACWLHEKVHYLVDDDFTWEHEEIITLAMPYIINGTPGHAEVYKWIPKNGENSLMEALRTIPASVTCGASLFPKDVLYVPEWWARCNVAENLTFWREHRIGGHFPSLERPATLVADVREFTKTVNAGDLEVLRKSGNRT